MVRCILSERMRSPLVCAFRIPAQKSSATKRSGVTSIPRARKRTTMSCSVICCGMG